MEKDLLHPFVPHWEQGWIPVENPYAPKPPKPMRTYTTKHVFIQADQLFYDVDAVTGIIDRASRQTQGAQEVATSESDTYRPMFYRWFDKYIGKAENCMSAFVMKPEGVNRLDALKEWQEREITLRMPDYWDATVYDALVDAIHQYVVNGALYEYLALTLTAKDPRTADKREQADEYYDLMRSLTCRVIPGSVRRPLKPF